MFNVKEIIKTKTFKFKGYQSNKIVWLQRQFFRQFPVIENNVVTISLTNMDSLILDVNGEIEEIGALSFDDVNEAYKQVEKVLSK